jgi:hypothetical protein
MPRYDYLCKANSQVVEVTHSISEKMKNWGEVCELASLDLGDVSADEPVEKIILTAPMANTPIGDAGIKDLGFTKLVKRDDGVYENVTRTGTESRYAVAGDPSTMPHLSKKLGD